jgi:hypothetical protein
MWLIQSIELIDEFIEGGSQIAEKGNSVVRPFVASTTGGEETEVNLPQPDNKFDRKDEYIVSLDNNVNESTEIRCQETYI